MEKKVTLRGIIVSLLDEKLDEFDDEYDNHLRRIQHAFDRLIERLGSDKEILKNRGDRMEFDESEVPFMKVILYQLYKKEGIIADFVKERNRNKKFSVREVHNLIQSLLDGADEAGMSEEDLMNLAQFFVRIFLVSPLRSIEYCHTLIDLLALNLQDLTSDEQALYLRRVEHFLKKEFGLRIAESMLHINELGYLIEEKRKLLGDDINGPVYYEHDLEIRYQLMQRDKAVLEAIQEDDDLRQYIEKKLGRKAEEVFNYAALDMEDKPE